MSMTIADIMVALRDMASDLRDSVNATVMVETSNGLFTVSRVEDENGCVKLVLFNRGEQVSHEYEVMSCLERNAKDA